jgi:hypothetical protein
MRPKFKNVAEASDGDRIGFGLERTLLNRGPRFEHDLVDLSKREAGNLDRSVGEDQFLELDLERVEALLPVSPGRLTARRRTRRSFSLRCSILTQGARSRPRRLAA